LIQVLGIGSTTHERTSGAAFGAASATTIQLVILHKKLIGNKDVAFAKRFVASPQRSARRTDCGRRPARGRTGAHPLLPGSGTGLDHVHSLRSAAKAVQGLVRAARLLRRPARITCDRRCAADRARLWRQYPVNYRCRSGGHPCKRGPPCRRVRRE